MLNPDQLFLGWIEALEDTQNTQKKIYIFDLSVYRVVEVEWKENCENSIKEESSLLIRDIHSSQEGKDI